MLKMHMPSRLTRPVMQRPCNRRFIAVTATPPPSSTDAASSSATGPVIAIGAVSLGVALFALRVATSGPTFETLISDSIPLDQALSNGKPTLIEFYASWCRVCQEMIPDTVDTERAYSKKVNFAMLNVDNTQWAEEVESFGVRGIPEYVWVDEKGQPKAVAIGRLPREVLERNTAALVEGKELPFAQTRGGEISAVTRADAMKMGAKPLDHS